MNETETVDRKAGRGWAYLGTILGASVSIAANVAHSFVPPSGLDAETAAAWSPHAGSVMIAVFWPVALFVVVEIFARANRRDLRWWTALRYVGLVPVALLAAVVSYMHLSGLLVYYGETTIAAYLGPLVVDSLMVIASGALIATARPSQVDVSAGLAMRKLSKIEAAGLETSLREAFEGKTVSAPVWLPAHGETDLITVLDEVSPRVSAERAPSRSRLEQVEMVKAAIPDWAERIVGDKEVALVLSISGKESIAKVKDVMYPDAPRTIKRLEAAAARKLVSA